jgi:hypothetical protein
MAQAVIRRPLTEEDLLRYEVIICEICGRKSGNGTDLFPNTGKGKGHTITGHEGTERGGQMYSSTLSFTSALDGVGGQRQLFVFCVVLCIVFVLFYVLFVFCVVLCIVFVLFYVLFVFCVVLCIVFALFYVLFVFCVVLCIVFVLFYVLFVFLCCYIIVFVLFYVLFLFCVVLCTVCA